MSLSLYEIYAPTYLRTLANLSSILGKAAEQAAARKIDPSVLVGDRLAPDMFPLSRQVQIACDGACRAGARLAGADIPSFPDTETTFEELQARIEKAVAFVKTLSAEAIDAAETKTVTIPLPSGALDFSGRDFLLGFALPNLYFHVTTTYVILRHNGIELGKADFLGGR
jgi:hypothetical protein